MRRSSTIGVVIASVTALLLVGCGSDETESSPSTVESATVASVTVESTATADTTATADITATAETTAPTSDTDTVPPTTAAEQPSTATFEVRVIGDFTSPALPAPDSVAAATAGLADVPGAVISECDSQGDANAALTCARDAVADGVSVVINSVSGLTQDYSILTEAAIPIVGNIEDYTAPNGFSISGGPAAYAQLGVGAAKAGCQRAGLLHVDLVPDESLDQITHGLEAEGAEEVARAATPLDAPDLSAPVAKLVDADVDCILLIILPTQVVQAMTALTQTGADGVQIVGFGALFPPEVIEVLGPLSDGVIATESQLSPLDDNATMAAFRDEIAAIDGDVTLTSAGITAWAAGRIIAAAVADADGPVDAASMLALLDAVRDVDLDGVYHPYSAVPLDSTTFARFFNHYGLNYQFTDGVPVTDGEFYDLAPVLAGS